MTGLLTAFVGQIPLETLWIAASIGLWVATVGIGLGLYTPTLRRQIALVEAGDVDGAEYRAVARRGLIRGRRARAHRCNHRVPDGHQADAVLIALRVA